MLSVDEAYRRARSEHDPVRAVALLREAKELREEIARSFGSVSGLIQDARQVELGL